jgi:hypothetical protein
MVYTAPTVTFAGYDVFETANAINRPSGDHAGYHGTP